MISLKLDRLRVEITNSSTIYLIMIDFALDHLVVYSCKFLSKDIYFIPTQPEELRATSLPFPRS